MRSFRLVLVIVALAVTLGAGLAACSEERDLGGACEGGACSEGVHPAGFLDPTSDAFHGKDLARRSWDFALCGTCHGADFKGGVVTGAVACTDCHADGPTACSTCHGEAGPTSGNHAPHHAAQLACSECHTVPTTWDAPGHLLGDTDGQAEINFGALAGLTPVPADRLGPPTYANGTCTNVYCHGGTLAAGGASTMPAWATPATGAPCAQCHGAPPPSHTQTTCVSCHPSDAAHIDGVVQVGAGAGCDGCHGSGPDGAPPRDLDGNLFTTSLGVGAHQAHLLVPSGLRAPIPCVTCHVVPTEVTSVGHIDSALPAEVTPDLGWDRTTGTCANAYCHGLARPVWTEQGGATCGSCHGFPPAIQPHEPSWGLITCAGCHPWPSSTAHMDGDVDVQ